MKESFEVECFDNLSSGLVGSRKLPREDWWENSWQKRGFPERFRSGLIEASGLDWVCIASCLPRYPLLLEIVRKADTVEFRACRLRDAGSSNVLH